MSETTLSITDSKSLASISIGKGIEAVVLPLTLGVPFARGQVSDVRDLQLVAGDQRTAVQAKSLMTWPDGSHKWVLLDWLSDRPDLDVRLEKDCESIEVESQVKVEEKADSVVVSVEGQEFVFSIGGDLAAAFDVCADADAKQLQLAVEQIKVVDHGPIRACVRFTGCFLDAGVATKLRWRAEGHFFASKLLQRWTFAIGNSRAAAHPGGIWELGDAGSIRFKEVSLRIPMNAATQAGISEDASADIAVGKEIDLYQASSGGKNWGSANHQNAENELPAFCGYERKIDGSVTTGSRANPFVFMESDKEESKGVYFEKFWQNFPSRLTASTSQSEVVIGLFPGDVQSDQREHELQGGEWKTHCFWIAQGKDVVEQLEAIRSRPTPRNSVEQFVESNAIRWATPLDETENANYRSLVERAVEGEQSYFAKREVIDEYGWRHFGDVYGDHEAAYSPAEPPLISHWNNQYDLVFGLGVRYMRGADDCWFELMEDMAWHVTDIDIYHTDEDKAAYNHGLFWHTVHYIDAGKANHRSYPRGSVGGGPCAEHAYARGLLLYYCLTGETAIRDAVEQMGDWILSLEDPSTTPFRFLCKSPPGLSSASGTPNYHGPGRGPGNASETLLTAFELTGRREFLERVEELMFRVVHPEEDLESLNLLDAEWRWYYNLYLQALGRYLEIKAELEEFDEAYSYGRETLLHYARWMAEHEYPYLEKPEILEYPTETWAAQDMRKSEVFHFASRHAAGEERETFFAKARYFYEYSVNELAQMETRHFCRPIALVLGSGFSYQGFRDASLQEPLPPGPKVEWKPKPKFIPQKTIAIKRAKTILVAGAGTACVAGVGTALFLLSLL